MEEHLSESTSESKSKSTSKSPMDGFDIVIMNDYDFRLMTPYEIDRAHDFQILSDIADQHLYPFAVGIKNRFTKTREFEKEYIEVKLIESDNWCADLNSEFIQYRHSKSMAVDPYQNTYSDTIWNMNVTKLYLAGGVNLSAAGPPAKHVILSE